ncbi:acyl carrier protein [Acinetobacter sp. XH1741]|uniref:acyl carrier protein n=2 Tax=Acinetobacter TaxID=469 RepID=UPI0032B3E819
MNIKQNVIKIWKNRTKDSQEKLSEDFFDVGGDSLGSIHLLVDLNNFFEIELDPNDFFCSPTLGNLIKITEQKIYE